MILLSTLLISMFVTMALIPILKTAALKLGGGLDVPNERKVHIKPVPKVGGVAMALGALLPVLLMIDGGDAAAIPFSILVIVGVTNAINLSDGLDGLAGGISLLIFICIGWLAFTGVAVPDRVLVLLLCAAVIGAIFGFLRFNTYPATVFMGDAGSQLLGFLAVTLALGITQHNAAFSPAPSR